jgi:hypothetical protein
MTNEEFFALFRRSAWRLEALPAYGTAESVPAFGTWLKTGELVPLAERPAKIAWMTAVREATAQGRRLGRVRILHQPRVPFEDYELATYPENVEAGEDVRIADAAEHSDLTVLDTDFWLLDDELVLVMDYDDDGRFRDLAPTRLPSVLRMARRRRDFAIARSVLLARYLATHEVRV